ncbi:hypothetical protein [[Mycoplasma] anseris]|nr:hypothetical protein [[Mycoplasma] anseris]
MTEANLIKQKKQKKEKLYFVSKDAKIIWTFILMLITFLTIISFINVKWLTTIHSYTINVLFGAYSSIFYLLAMLFSIWKLFNLKKTYSYKIFHFSLSRLAFLGFCVLLLGTTIMVVSSFHLKFNTGESFKNVFGAWFNQFKQDNDVYLPYKYSTGVIGIFFYSIFSLFGAKSGQVIAFIISILLLFLSISFFFISDQRFSLLSLNKAKREKAKELRKIKNKTSVQLNHSKNLLDNNLINNNDRIIDNNKLQEQKHDLSELDQITIENDVVDIISNKPEQISEAQNNLTNTNNLNLEEVEFDLDPFDDTLEISNELEQTGVIEKTSVIDEYVSKHVDAKEMEEYLEKSKEFEKPIPLEEQEYFFNNLDQEKPQPKNETKNKRYSLIEDKDKMF